MHTIAVVTGTRAEYGLLRPVIQKLMAHKGVNMRLVATGTHLSRAYGHTIDEIAADGLPVDAEIDILGEKEATNRLATARRTAVALEKFTQYFAATRPSAVVLLGDRYEIFAVAQAAALLGIPVAHISGGDVTHGADDDWFRHCITKMAKLHFPSCAVYAQRLFRMGEEPWRVYNVGGLGDENIRSLNLYSREKLGESLQLDLNRPYAMVTFHPETTTGIPAQKQADALLAAMEQRPDLFYVISKANADAGGEVINQHMQQFCETHENAALFASLGVLRYLSALKHAALVLGNSSSGVVETPTLGVPTVDIGARQQGRIRPANVVHARLDTASITDAIDTALSEEFTQTARNAQSPYNGGDTSGKIVAALVEALDNGSLQAPKEFYDGE